MNTNTLNVENSVTAAMNDGNELTADEKAQVLVRNLYDGGVIPPAVMITARRDGFNEFGGINISTTGWQGPTSWFRFALVKDQDDLQKTINRAVDRAIQQTEEYGSLSGMWGDTVNLFQDFPRTYENTNEHIRFVFESVFGSLYMEENTSEYDIEVRASDDYSRVYFTSPQTSTGGFLSSVSVPEDGTVRVSDLEDALNRANYRMMSRMSDFTQKGPFFVYESPSARVEIPVEETQESGDVKVGSGSYVSFNCFQQYAR